MPFPESPTASSAGVIEDPKLIVFDPYSDLTFEVGDNTHKVSCQVDAKSVARASHVFRRMLFGGFAESKPSEGEWIVSLPEDDINAMAIIFNIIHGHVHKVPKILPKNMAELVGPSSHCYHDDAVETDMLYLVTTAADKYDIIHLLRPWVKYWLERVRCKKRWSQKGWDDNWCAELLWAAWILGDHDLLYSQLNKVVLSAKMAGSSPSGSKSAREVFGLCVVDSFGNEIMMSQDVSGPSRILEILDVWGQIFQKRLDTLELFQDDIWTFIHRPSSFVIEDGEMLVSYIWGSSVDESRTRNKAYKEVRGALNRSLLALDIPRHELKFGRYMGTVTKLRNRFRALDRCMDDILGPARLGSDDPKLKIFCRLMRVIHINVPDKHLIELDDTQEREFCRAKARAGIW